MSKSKVRNNDYLFLSAMIRAREASMANGDTLRRMLDAADFAEAARIAAECGWPDMSAMDVNGINTALSQRAADILVELTNFLPDKSIADVFRLKYDYHNAKVLIKSGAVGVPGERLLSSAGRVSPEKLVQAYNEGDFSDLPKLLGEAMEQARGILSRTSNPQLSDICLDKAYFAELSHFAADCGSEFLGGYAKLLIDSANLKTFVRTKRMNKDSAFLEAVMIPGGSVSPEAIIAAAKENESPAAVFGATPLARAAAIGAQVMQGGSLTEFELECDNTATRYLTKAKMASFGPEPVIAYLAALEQEATSLRMILTGKLSGIPADTIRERLRETYA